jgi:alkylated DNA repair dioxygenase AlkB
MRFHELSAPHDGSVRSFKAVRAPRTGRRVDVWLPVGSLLVLRGDARYRWQHEIVGRKKGREGVEWRRVSLTFRVEKRGG